VGSQAIIKAPLATEKLTSLTERFNQVAFWVALEANKFEIANAVKKAFNVTVIGVRTIVVPSRMKRKGSSVGRISKWKKAIVTLKEGDKIDFQSAE
jgi:large subunit ribosomal protein L23